MDKRKKKAKKPFYKQTIFWLVLVIVVLLVGIGGSFVISHHNKQVAKNKIVLVVSKNKKWKNRYDQIKVGEASQNGKGGSSPKQVIKIAGHPNEGAPKPVEGKTKTWEWLHQGILLMVDFKGQHVIRKSITVNKGNTKRPHLMDKRSVKEMKIGTTYQAVIKKYGEPDALSESKAFGQKYVTGTWLSGVKGKGNPAITYFFKNDKLFGKYGPDVK